jgi:RNA 2',3'-cyclic 3'-phosphodiesterase
VRLFVALEIRSAVRDNLAALIDQLREADARGWQHRPRWVRPENLHVTLKFIGHIDDAKLDSIRVALAEVHSKSAVDIEFHAIGFFPGDKRPRVLWTGIKGSSSLVSLAHDIDRRLELLGIPCETREFTPHLTLARFDPPGISEKLRAAVQATADRTFGALRTGEFHLIESKLKRAGAEYTTLQTFRFAAEA